MLLITKKLTYHIIKITLIIFIIMSVYKVFFLSKIGNNFDTLFTSAQDVNVKTKFWSKCFILLL